MGRLLGTHPSWYLQAMLFGRLWDSTPSNESVFTKTANSPEPSKEYLPDVANQADMVNTALPILLEHGIMKKIVLSTQFLQNKRLFCKIER